MISPSLWKCIQLTVCFVEIDKKSPFLHVSLGHPKRRANDYQYISEIFSHFGANEKNKIKSVFWEDKLFPEGTKKKKNNDMVFLYEIVTVCLAW